MCIFFFARVFGVGGFPGGLYGKESAYSAGALGSIPGLGRSPGERNGNPLLYSCLENPVDRGYSPQGPKETDMTERLTHLLPVLQCF